MALDRDREPDDDATQPPHLSDTSLATLSLGQ